MRGLPGTIAMGLLLLASAGAAAAGAPGGADLARIDAALGATARARLTTVRGVAIVSESHATAAGVAFRNLLSSQRADTLRSPGLVTWDEIQRIDGQGRTRGSLTRGRLALTGFAIGTGLGVSGAFFSGWANAGGLGIFLFPPAGAGLGYVAGRLLDRDGREWRPLYP